MPRLVGDVSVVEQPGLVHPGIELGFHALVVQVCRPGDEIVHRALRTVAVIDLQGVTALQELLLCAVQGLRGRTGENAHRRVVAVDPVAGEVVLGGIAGVHRDGGVDIGQRDKVRRCNRFRDRRCRRCTACCGRQRCGEEESQGCRHTGGGRGEHGEHRSVACADSASFVSPGE